MSLGAGSRLGPYETSAKLGESGMGEVYRACGCDQAAMTDGRSTTTARIGSMRTQSVDTPQEIEEIQVQLFREMGPRGRLAVAAELNEALDDLARAGIRSRHGELPEAEARLRLFALRLSRQQMVQAFAWDPARS